MVARPQDMQSEIEVLAGKIDALKQMSKGGRHGHTDMDSYLVKRLKQYEGEHARLLQTYNDFYGDVKAG